MIKLRLQQQTVLCTIMIASLDIDSDSDSDSDSDRNCKMVDAEGTYDTF